VFLTEEKIE
jgi:hypothetical protein